MHLPALKRNRYKILLLLVWMKNFMLNSHRMFSKRTNEGGVERLPVGRNDIFFATSSSAMRRSSWHFFLPASFLHPIDRLLVLQLSLITVRFVDVFFFVPFQHSKFQTWNNTFCRTQTGRLLIDTRDELPKYHLWAWSPRNLQEINKII